MIFKTFVNFWFKIFWQISEFRLIIFPFHLLLNLIKEKFQVPAVNWTLKKFVKLRFRLIAFWRRILCAFTFRYWVIAVNFLVLLILFVLFSKSFYWQILWALYWGMALCNSVSSSVVKRFLKLNFLFFCYLFIWLTIKSKCRSARVGIWCANAH